ncbi:MAG TPA: LCP family protein [Candidatus Saccharimonadia bacterium]|nr:LCP family protein [Candidatus Saccharimonadia bacterium]
MESTESDDKIAQQRPEQYSDAAQERSKRRWPKVVGLIVLLLVVATGVYAGLLVSNVAKISTNPLDLSGLTTDVTGRTNILILGIGDPGHAGQQLSDTMMVVSLDTKTKRVAQISIPRDLRVAIPDHGTAKVNAANALGGAKLAEQTVSNTLNIPINYYVETNFTGLRSLVDAVGGIDVTVKQRLVDTEYPCDDDQYKVCGLDIEPGLQHMDGVRALQYARCRKGTCGNDFGRASRQQEVINLVRQKATSWQTLLNPGKLAALTGALRQSLTTDMGTVQMLQLAYDWQQAQANSPIQLVLSTQSGNYLKGALGSSDLLPIDGTFDAIQNRVHNIFSVAPQSSDVPE